MKALPTRGVVCAIIAAVALAAVLVTAGATFMATTGPAASQQEPTVSIEDGQVPRGGTEVTRLWALNVSQPALCGFTVHVGYIPHVNMPTGCDFDPERKFSGLCNPNHPDDIVVVTGARATGVTGDIPLADITWCAVGDAGASAPLDVQIVNFKDCSSPPVEITPVADQGGVNVIVDGAPPVDSDGDGFGDCRELYLGTDPADACTNQFGDRDAWPFDIDMDTCVSILDILRYKPKLWYCYPHPSHDPRYDLNADGCVNILDVLMYKPVMITCCQP
ncbi:MAG: thrombospondin type 3 repeat-containing protein [Dehalococcoidia bacterium]